MKKSRLAAAAAFLALPLLVGCGEYKLSVSANWYADPSVTNSVSGTYEKLTYSVQYMDDATNQDYSVTYTGGSYVTELKNDVYTWEDGSKEEVYVLNTSFAISGTYRSTLTDAKQDFADSIETTCIFRTVDKSLVPIYSFRSVHSSSPIGLGPMGDEMCIVYDYETTVEYDKNCENARVTVVGLEESEGTQTRDFDVRTNYSLYDNEQVLFIGRALNHAVGGSNSFNMLDPNAGKLQTVKMACGSADKRKFTLGGEEVEANCKVVEISLETNYGGGIQRAYYAAKPDTGVNTYRNALVYLETPLAYNLGTLTYSLTEAVFTVK